MLIDVLSTPVCSRKRGFLTDLGIEKSTHLQLATTCTRNWDQRKSIGRICERGGKGPQEQMSEGSWRLKSCVKCGLPHYLDRTLYLLTTKLI